MENGLTAGKPRESRYILVVDSKTDDLFTCSMLLQRFEYRVCTANTAGQALEMVSVAAPSLVIADLILPGMSGLDLLRLFKFDPRTASIPVVLLCPAADPSAEKRCRETEASECLTKPLDAESLFRAVQTSIESRPRTNIRIPTKLSVTVNSAPLASIEGECASVLSEHGMYIRMRKPYQRDEILNVELQVNGKRITADATVLYSHRFDDGPFREPGMGLKFLTLAPEDREFIRQFIRAEITRGILT